MLIDGRALAQNINQETKLGIAQLDYQPLLVDIMVGSDPASLSYVRIKQKKAESVGLKFELCSLSESVTTAGVLQAIEQISRDKNLRGLIVQLPLPAHLDTEAILNHISSLVDVDVLGKIAKEKFYLGQNKLVPPTAAAIMAILDSLKEDYEQIQFVVLGQGELVGKPVTHLLKQRNYKVDIVVSDTDNRAQLLANADCIISGVGKPGIITVDQVKSEAIIIDAGTSEASGSIIGDASGDVANKVKYITPVPGGVGPVTVAMLLRNTLLMSQ